MMICFQTKDDLLCDSHSSVILNLFSVVLTPLARGTRLCSVLLLLMALQLLCHALAHGLVFDVSSFGCSCVCLSRYRVSDSGLI
jgi:hypothetical protein